MAEIVSRRLLQLAVGGDRQAMRTLFNAVIDALESNAACIDAIAAGIDADSGTIGTDYVATHVAGAADGGGTAVAGVAENLAKTE